MINFVELWVYLSGSPLLWLTATLVAYIAADAISAALHHHPFANPVLMAVALLALILLVTGTKIPCLFCRAQFVHFLLGPATVALAIPLVRYLPEVRRTIIPMSIALVVVPLQQSSLRSCWPSCSASIEARCLHLLQSLRLLQSPWELLKRLAPNRP